MGNTQKSANNALCSSDSGSIVKGKEVPAVRKKKELTFSPEDYEALCENRYGRFIPNSKTVIGNAVISSNGKQVVAHQYAMPKSNGDVPTWTPLKNITPIQRFGRQVYSAKTLAGETVYASRSYTFTDENNKEYTFLPFSPPPPGKKEPFWGSSKELKIFKRNPKGKDYIIGGRELEVDPESVIVRSAEKTRTPDQNTVMGCSAKEAQEFYYEQMAPQLTPEMRWMFERAITVANGSNYRPEWLHAEGHSLTPLWIDPQRSDNLGSAAKWANTAMMVFETLAKYYAVTYPGCRVTIKPTFVMVGDSEIIKYIDFEVSVYHHDKSLCFQMHLEPLRQKFPVFSKASDIAQLTKISQAKLNDSSPDVESVISSTGGGRYRKAANATKPLFYKDPDEMDIDEDAQSSTNRTSADYSASRSSSEYDDKMAVDDEALAASSSVPMDVDSIDEGSESDDAMDIDNNAESSNSRPSQMGLFAQNSHGYNLRHTAAREHAVSYN